MGDVVGSLLATLALDPSIDARAVAPVAICGAPSVHVAAMLSTALPVSVPRATPGMVGQAISRAADGLFYVEAIVNGAPVRFLIDTGATTIVLTQEDAKRAGVLPGEAAFTEIASTAGGAAAMARIRLARLTVGRSIDFDVPAAVAGGKLGVSLLGASWLTNARSLTITGDSLVLQ